MYRTKLVTKRSVSCLSRSKTGSKNELFCQQPGWRPAIWFEYYVRVSKPISDQQFRADHPRDKRFEQMRALAAEQQALRNQRNQTNPQLPDAFFQFKPAEAQQIASAGIVGSKRLAENLEGMLRDKPKFNFFEANSSGAAQQSGESFDENSGSFQEPASFVPGELASQLPLFDRRPRRAAEDPDSRDLNLSPQNRQQALTQGLPSTQAARAAAQLFRPQETQEQPAPVEQPQTSSGGEATEVSTPVSSALVSSDESSLASRGTLNFDRSRISTASDTLGETRGTTDNQLVLNNDDAQGSDLAVRQELGRQSSVEDESRRRGDAAQGALDTARGRENQLNQQKDGLESAKGQQRAFASDSAAMMERHNQLLDQQTQNIAATQKAGEASLNRINQLDSQVEDNTRVREQASSDQANSQQNIAQLQNQVTSLQNAPTPKAPGNSNSQGNGNQAKQASADAAAAQQQQAVSSAQTQLAAAQKQQEEARKRQQNAEAAIQSGQAAAQAERTSLEQSRTNLSAQQDARKTTQDRARAHGAAAQEDQDRIKDLTSHSQDLKGQFDEVTAAREEAAASLRKNRGNAAAAHENVQQLRSLETDLNEPRPQNHEQNPLAGERLNKPGVSDASEQSLPADRSSDIGAAKGGGTQVRRSGDKTIVQLNSLDQSSGSASKDNLSGVSKNRGSASDGGDLGDASLAAAAAAAGPKESGGSSESLGSDSHGHGHDNDDQGGGPGNGHGNAFGHHKGKG